MNSNEMPCPSLLGCFQRRLAGELGLLSPPSSNEAMRSVEAMRGAVTSPLDPSHREVAVEAECRTGTPTLMRSPSPQVSMKIKWEPEIPPHLQKEAVQPPLLFALLQEIT